MCNNCGYLYLYTCILVLAALIPRYVFQIEDKNKVHSLKKFYSRFTCIIINLSTLFTFSLKLVTTFFLDKY